MKDSEFTFRRYPLFVRAVIGFVLLSSFATAQTPPATSPEESHGGLISHFDPFSFELKDPERPRATFWPQLACFFLPGFDQWWEGQNSAAVLYSGLALGGTFVASTSGGANVNNSSAATQISEGSDSVRAYLLGNKIYEAAGELSLYHSFRSAVRTRQAHGEYNFLPRDSEETPDQLMTAPFRFSFLERPTTFIPLGLAALAVVTSSVKGHQMRLSDGFYATSNSYLAGVGEESAFRGYIMPRLMESFDSPFWSNATSSVLFGAAHIASDNQYPFAQLLFGFYVGWVDQQNQWTISEGIFIHAWWDAILLLYQLSDHTSVANPVVMPLFSTTF